MKLFNIDLHISVIADIKSLLEELGHSVTDLTLSGHSWIMGRQRDDVAVINHNNWTNIDEAMCDEFYRRYKRELDCYDAFIVTYAPCLSMLFKSFGKPIIIVAATRYEYPFTSSKERWTHFNNFLQVGIDSGLIIPLANNRYDAAYAELFTGRKWRVIQSFCGYTYSSYRPSLISKYLYWSKSAAINLKPPLIERDHIKGKRRTFLPFSREKSPYTWADLERFRCIVHVPYNVSVMSMFEQYTSCIPMLFPSQDFLLELYGEGDVPGVLSEISFCRIMKIPPGSIIGDNADDPNAYRNTTIVRKWLKLADFYDDNTFPHLTYFDSENDLYNRLRKTNWNNVSRRMAEHNRLRKSQIREAWEAIMLEVSS